MNVYKIRYGTKQANLNGRTNIQSKNIELHKQPTKLMPCKTLDIASTVNIISYKHIENDGS